jgi:RNA polymerase sigma-70 factor (ECF subfamily)
VDEPPISDPVAALRSRDPAALRWVYGRYKETVLAVASAVLGRGRAANDAADVLQDVFVGLARSAAALAPDTNLRAYLARAAANRAKDRLRRREPPTLDREMLASVPVAPVDAVEGDVEALELWSRVEQLPEEQRTVVALHVWGEMSFRTIAELLDISENTAQSRWRYALEKLRKHYVEEAER